MVQFKTNEKYPRVYPFSFDDVLGAGNRPTLSFKVRCDMLKSF